MIANSLDDFMDVALLIIVLFAALAVVGLVVEFIVRRAQQRKH